MLEVEGIETGYGETRVVHGLDLTVREGTVHALLGRNGVGKSTTLKSVIGQLPVTAGTVRLAGQQISGRLPHDIARLGVAYVPETRDIFGALTVRENLELAGRLHQAFAEGQFSILHCDGHALRHDPGGFNPPPQRFSAEKPQNIGFACTIDSALASPEPCTQLFEALASPGPGIQLFEALASPEPLIQL